MKFLTRLATGQIALWRTFWLIEIPLALLWLVTGAGMVLGWGVEQPLIAGCIITLFTFSSVALPFAAITLWRSASHYPQAAWWQKLLAIGAKLCAAFWGLAGALSVVGLLYLAYEFIEAALT